MPETWGKMEKEKVFIIRSVFNRVCTDNGYNPASFLSWLKRNDMIESEGRGYTKRVRLNGMRCQCVVLKTNILPEFGFAEIPNGFSEVPENEQMEF